MIGYLEPSDGEEVSKVSWVKWKEGNRLVFWEPAAHGFDPKDTLVHSRRNIDLAKDLVAGQEEIGSSTFLQTREWASAIERDCQKHGKHYQIIVP